VMFIVRPFRAAGRLALPRRFPDTMVGLMGDTAMMDTSWLEAVDNYCERIDASFWSEPLNAVSNAAFIIGALLAWAMARRAGRSGDPAIRLLTILHLSIGVGSFLFHTFAQRWAGVADVIPILLFIMVYIGFAARRFAGLPGWGAALVGLGYAPFSAVALPALSAVFGSLNGSIGYAPVLLVFLGFAAVLRNRAPVAARGVLIGAGILTVSLFFRSVDQAVCDAWPYGTHFVWHTLNGVLLTWMTILMIREGAPVAARARPA